MAYKPTVLNISALAFFAGICAYSLRNYKMLSAGGGWGLVSIICLTAISMVAALLDLLLQDLIKKRITLNIIEAIITAGAALWLYLNKI